MKILITGGKTATALKLVKAFERAKVVLGDYGDVPSIKNTLYSFENLGEWNDEVLAHNLLTKCLDFGVDTLLPLFEQEIVAVAKSLVLFEEFGIRVLVPKEPEFDHKKFSNWCVFQDNKMMYTSVPVQIENSEGLNGAYYFDSQTAEFSLISISGTL